MRTLNILIASLVSFACTQQPAESSPTSASDANDASAAGASQPAESTPKGGLGISGISSTDELPRQKAPPPPADVTATVRLHERELRVCYDQARSKSPELGDTLNLRLAISKEGKLTNSGVAPESTLKDQAVQECILQHFREMSFSPSDKIRLVSYPLSFAAAP